METDTYKESSADGIAINWIELSASGVDLLNNCNVTAYIISRPEITAFLDAIVRL